MLTTNYDFERFQSKESGISTRAEKAVNSIHIIYANLLMNSEYYQKQIDSIPKQQLSTEQNKKLIEIETQIQDIAGLFSGDVDDILLYIQDWGSKNNKQLEDKGDLFIDLSNIKADAFEINTEILGFHKDYCKAETKKQSSVFPSLMKTHASALAKHISFLLLRAKSISWSMKRVFPEFKYDF